MVENDPACGAESLLGKVGAVQRGERVSHLESSNWSLVIGRLLSRSGMLQQFALRLYDLRSAPMPLRADAGGFE